MRKTTPWLFIVLISTALFSASMGGYAQNPAASWPALPAAVKTTGQRSLDRGLAYLRQNQKPDGSWDSHEGITGLAVLAFLKQPGGAKKDVAYTDKGLKFIASKARPDGSIWAMDMAAVNTAIAIMAFKQSGKPEYAALVKKGQDYLVKAQFDEGEGHTKSDKNYGGIGYDDESRADLSNLHHVLEALKETDLPDNSNVWDKALTFIQRTQNRKASNDIGSPSDDGGFMYMPGMSFAGGATSYGSMTYAGLLSYNYSNLKKNDERVVSAHKWISTNYTLDENPGLGKTTLYYYYMVFAKGLRVYGEPTIADGKGQKHDWRQELVKKLSDLQYPEGYWVNKDDPSHWQDNKILVTTFTSTALDYALNDSLKY